MKITTLLVLSALILPVPAGAQVKPVDPQLDGVKLPAPGRTPQAPSEPVRPGAPTRPLATPTFQPTPGPMQRVGTSDRTDVSGLAVRQPIAMFAPSLSMRRSGSGRASVSPGQTYPMEVKFSGLAGMKAVQVISLKPGCDFEPALNMSAENQLTPNRQSPPTFSSDRNGGYPVSAAGVAEFTIVGRGAMKRLSGDTPSRWDAQEVNNRSRSAMTDHNSRPATGFAPYLHHAAERYTKTNTAMSNLECTPEAVIALQDMADRWTTTNAAGQWVPLASAGTSKPIVGSKWALDFYQRVTIDSTWRLKDKFNPEMRPKHGLSFSTCSGISVGPHGNKPVGVHNRNGDIAFIIRSGPLGTDCLATTTPAPLPEGVIIESIRFKIERVNEKCYAAKRTAGEIVADGVLMIGAGMIGTFGELSYKMYANEYSSASPFGEAQRLRSLVEPPILVEVEHEVISGTRLNETLISDPSIHGYINPYTPPLNQTATANYDLIKPFYAHLSCEMALSNDHEIALILDRIVALVPANVTF